MSSADGIPPPCPLCGTRVLHAADGFRVICGDLNCDYPITPISAHIRLAGYVVALKQYANKANWRNQTTPDLDEWLGPGIGPDIAATALVMEIRDA